MRLPLQVSIHLFRKGPAAIETLLLKRTEARGGFWQGVTGGLQPGESLEEAALREVREETGLEAVQLLATGYFFRFPISARWRDAYAKEDTHVVEHVFAAAVFAGDKIAISDEHVHFAWLPVEEAAAQLTAFPTQAEALRQARDAYVHHGVTCDPTAGGSPSAGPSTPRRPKTSSPG